MRRLCGRHPTLAFQARTALVVVGVVILERITSRLLSLPPESYQRPYLFVEVVRHLGAARVVAAMAALAAMWRYGHLRCDWTSIDADGPIRAFVGIIALVVVWMASASGYNYYAGQGHAVDRVLALVLLLMLWYRPVFIFPLLALACALIGQAAAPALGGTFLAHPLQLVHVLNAFAAALLVFGVTGVRSTDSFVFVTLCVVGGSYFVSGLEKLRIGWLTYGHLDLMPLTAYAHGWLSFLEPSAIVTLATHLPWLDWPMRIGVLCLEVACLGLLWRRSLAMFLLAAAVAFHAGTFLLNGFLFWNWMLLDGALVGVLRLQRLDVVQRVFSLRSLPLSMLLIASADHWVGAPRLAWFDTPLATAYSLEAIGASGTRYTLPPTYFAPYQDVFTMSSFGYLTTERRLLTRPYGVVFDRELADRLVRTKTHDEVLRLERLAGPAQPDPERTARFAEFIRQFVANRERLGDPSWLDTLFRPPRLYWSFDRGNVYTRQEAIQSVAVVEETWFFDGDRLERIRQLEVLRVAIGD